MKHLDLFSGIGGFAYAAQTVWGSAYENVGFCDNNQFCQKVLKRNFPHATIHGDIRQLNPAKGAADVITGGFPCQPFSQAGKREGAEDDRYLWPEMLRVIRTVEPTWVVAENVYGLITLQGGMVFEQVCTSLEAIGFSVWTFIIPACATGAPHKRDRVWIVAYSEGKRWDSVDEKQGDQRASEYFEGYNTFWRYCADLHLVMEPDWAKPSSGIRRNDDGLSAGVDRLTALGNAIVPQVAIEIFKAIKTLNN